MGDSEVSHKVNEEGSGVEVSGKIMLAAIIVLFVVILFILFLHLYARWWLWGRRTQAGTHRQSRTGRRRFVFAATQDPIFSYHRGLHPSVIRSLPVLIFNTDHFKDALECAVCLSELSDGEKARLLPKCNHGFHVDCIDMWFQSHSTCPLCRNTVALESESSTTPELSEIESPSQGNSESLNFPTNVLFWGNETQVSTRGSTGLEEEGPSSSSSSLPNSSRLDESLVIEIPRLQLPDFSSSLSPSSRPAEEEFKSPATSRLRSLRRLLSREKRVIPGFPWHIDFTLGRP